VGLAQAVYSGWKRWVLMYSTGTKCKKLILEWRKANDDNREKWWKKKVTTK